MPARKRAIEEVEGEVEAPPPEPTPPLLLRLRNLWEFACLVQYIYLFGEAVKIDKEIDIDFIEAECLKPTPSDVFSQIGLALLKNVSSHRGLTPEIFDEYTRRQYLAKAPHRNPFGEEEEPNKFADFDVVQKIRVLHQLSVWTLHNPDRIRQHYAEEVVDQTAWRIEELGWDRDDRTYFVLDDNRLYRLTKPQIRAPPKPKAKPKAKPKPKPKRAKGSRSSKRQKLASGDADSSEAEEENMDELPPVKAEEEEDNGLGGAKWECVAITLEEYNSFMDPIRKSKDPDEKALVIRIADDILPELERQAASRERKLAQQRRDLIALQKLATAKRSSRLADKFDKIREQQETEAAERKQKEELAMAHREQEKQRHREESRESRMHTREQRLKEREMKRILLQEELRKLEEQERQSDSGDGRADGRASGRHRQFEMEKQRQELEKYSEAEDEWYFDCAVCGQHGKNYDDGTHNIACEKCNVWQHSKCHGIKEDEAESDDFHFVCASCKKPIKLRIKSPEENKSVKPTTAASQKVNGITIAIGHGDAAAAKSSSASARVASSPSQPPLYNWSTAQAFGGPLQQPNGHHYPQVPQAYQQPYNHRSPNGFANGYPPPTTSSSPYSGPTPNGSLPQTHTSATSPKIRQQHQQSPPKSSTPFSYNPHHNDFGKQRLYLNPSRTPSTNPRPLSQGSTQNGPSPSPEQTLQRQQYPQPFPPSAEPHRFPVVTPQSSFQSQLSAPHISASPTPNLFATQGSTSIRFSPTASRSVSSTHAYVPDSNQPSAAAYSPTKQSSPPATQIASHHQRYPSNPSNMHGPGVGVPSPKMAAHIPTLQSSSPSAGDRNAGISPVKHDMPPSSPAVARGLGISGPVDADTRRGEQSHGAGLLTTPPELKANVGTENEGRGLMPPVKKVVGEVSVSTPSS